MLQVKLQSLESCLVRADNLGRKPTGILLQANAGQ